MDLFLALVGGMLAFFGGRVSGPIFDPTTGRLTKTFYYTTGLVVGTIFCICVQQWNTDRKENDANDSLNFERKKK